MKAVLPLLSCIVATFVTAIDAEQVEDARADDNEVRAVAR